MVEILLDAHSVLRWAVLGVLLLVGAYALLRSAGTAEFVRWPFSSAVAVLDLQFLLGVVLYVWNRGWDQGAFIAWIHPLVMTAVVAIAHVAVVRADREGGRRAYQIVGAAFTGLVGLTALGIPWAS